MLVRNHIIRVAIGTALILLIPLLAMRVSDEMRWDETDFIVAGALTFGTGVAYVLLTRKVTESWHKVAIGAALAMAFLLIWIELAVGLFTDIGS